MSNWESVPAYVRVLEDLRRKIETGQIPPGYAIPSVSAMVERYGVGATTAQKVIRGLKAAGLVDALPGKGVYVREVRRRVSRSGDFVTPVPDGTPIPHGRSTPPQVSRIIPPDDIAEVLQLWPAEHVVRRRRVMFDDDDIPMQIGISYIPASIADGTELAQPARLRGAVPAALKRAGYPPRSPAKERVTGRMPTAEEAKILRITAGIPVLRTLRVTCTDHRRPIEALEIVFSGDVYELEYDLPIMEES